MKSLELFLWILAATATDVSESKMKCITPAPVYKNHTHEKLTAAEQDDSILDEVLSSTDDDGLVGSIHCFCTGASALGDVSDQDPLHTTYSICLFSCPFLKQ